ncbi:hypothetical protein LJR296_001413 [Cupriavidus necator]
MKRGEDFLCEFERKHPILFGWALALLVLLLYVVGGDSASVFALTGSPS